MKKKRGEMWCLNKILQCLKTPKTQMQICKFSHVANHQLHDYLEKLVKLGYIKNMNKSNKILKNRSKRKKGIYHTSAIIWKATAKGKEFNKIIGRYAQLK